jgi:hypothetical protein
MIEEHRETIQKAPSIDLLLVGIKTGKCDICKQTKQILLLRYGFTLCENCLNVCTDILEKLQTQTTEQDLKNQFKTAKQEHAKITLTETKPSRKTKSPKAKNWVD